MKFLIITTLIILIGLSLTQTIFGQLPPCPSRNIWAPICASDGRTYENDDKLKCQQAIDPTVRFIKEGPFLIFTSLNFLMCTLILTEIVVISSNTENIFENFNVRRCPVSSIMNLVCASNGRTYYNEDFLRCEREINPSLKIIKEGVC
ncbi:serine protease inhibitor dipetalogastin-like [Condylostylus longicornis]|uniref:serine protease inhibitor dipetalogastin-like n=1 Tax=Condylostylus longicornis TaxID=2530218 RepID=UPI00244E2C52|nr:serine protease inhibitor dipetalogastin-like [Condylostylus longicornis]